MKKEKINIKFLALLLLLTLTQSCSIVKKIAGADINPVQFQKAREAKMLEVRYNSASKLLDRLNSSGSVENSDMTIYLDEQFIQSLAKQYEGSRGWLDVATDYIVDSVKVKLYNGSAAASLILNATNSDYNVDVNLKLDCIMALEERNNELFAQLEPYNLYPIVTAHGLLSSAQEIIENLVKINLAEVGKQIQKMKLPVDFSKSIIIPGSSQKVEDRINLNVISEKKQLNYKMKIKEVLIFEGKILIAVNMNDIKVE